MGRGIHIVKARVSARMGARMNIEIEDVVVEGFFDEEFNCVGDGLK